MITMKLTLTNIQTWVNTTIDLKQGMATIPVADNNVGKSVPIKALLVALLGNYRGPRTNKYIIRHDCYQGKLHLEFDDGREWECIFYPTMQVHKIKNVSTGDWEAYESIGAPPNVIAYLGWYVDKQYEYVANIVDPSRCVLGMSTTPQQLYSALRPLLEPSNLKEMRRKSEDLVQLLTPEITYTQKSLTEMEMEHMLHRLESEEEMQELINNKQKALDEINDILLVDELTNKVVSLNEYKIYDREQLSILLLTTELSKSLSELSKYKVYDRASLECYAPIVDYVEMYEKVKSNKVLDSSQLKDYYTILKFVELSVEINTQRIYPISELEPLRLVLDMVANMSKLPRATCAGAGELDLLYKIVRTVSLLTSHDAHGKNNIIRAKHIKNREATIAKIIEEMDKEKRKYLCPECGYDMQEVLGKC